MKDKEVLSLEMFRGVNNFNGIDHNNLIVEGETDTYVPFVVRQLWFRSVYPKGMVKTHMVGSLEDTIRYKLCVFNAEAYDNDGKLLSMGHGSANTDEENFIETAERRAVTKALASAGFTWHNGDFSKDTDMSNAYLQTYNSYINTGIFDITDIQVIRLYEDALVTILPEGYGAEVGQPIAAMKEERIEEIAKNYAIINNGDPLINAKIKFVYMYQSIEKQLKKQPKNLDNDTNQENSKKDKKRGGRRSKQSTTTDNVINIQEKKQDITSTEVVEEPSEIVIKAEEPEQAAMAAEVVEEPSETVIKAEEPEQVAMAAEVVEDPFGAVTKAEVIEPDEQNISSYIDIDKIFDAEADDENFDDDLQTSLEEWGYNTIEELTNNWKSHMEKIKKRNMLIDWNDVKQVLKYVESIPIYNNFLWADKAKKDEVVLLGEFLKKYQNETIEMLNNGTFPLPTLRIPIMWYIQYMW